MNTINQEELKAVIYALTLKDRGGDKRNIWLKKGFNKINKRADFLITYWKNRLEKNNPEDHDLYQNVLADYRAHLLGGIKEKQSALPSLSEQAKTLAGAGTNWVKSGFKTVDQETFDGRLDICKGCEFWDAAGMLGTGRCTKCGCSTQAKLRMATEKCPIDKWLQVN